MITDNDNEDNDNDNDENNNNTNKTGCLMMTEISLYTTLSIFRHVIKVNIALLPV